MQWLPHLLRMYTTPLLFHEFSSVLWRNIICRFLKVNNYYWLYRDKRVIDSLTKIGSYWHFICFCFEALTYTFRLILKAVLRVTSPKFIEILVMLVNVYTILLWGKLPSNASMHRTLVWHVVMHCAYASLMHMGTRGKPIQPFYFSCVRWFFLCTFYFYFVNMINNHINLLWGATITIFNNKAFIGLS